MDFELDFLPFLGLGDEAVGTLCRVSADRSMPENSTGWDGCCVWPALLPCRQKHEVILTLHSFQGSRRAGGAMTQSHQGQGETVVSGASRPLSISTLLRCCRVLVMETGNYRSPWWCPHWVCLRLLALKTPRLGSGISFQPRRLGLAPRSRHCYSPDSAPGSPALTALSSNLPWPPLPSQHSVSTQPQGTFPQAC